ncbi:MAG: acetyl-CoA C-acyltransferase [Myxococcota bacterium]
MDAFIYDAVRTPRGRGVAPRDERPGGGLHRCAPQELVRQLVDALDERTGAIGRVRRLILGCVGQVKAQGGHIALISKLASKVPNDASAKTLNNYCVSGQSAVNESALWAASDQGLTLAGGVEMLSRVPFLADEADYYSGETAQELHWLLPLMGAELMAAEEGYEKPDLDALTLRSHRRASAAWKAGHYDASVIPVQTDASLVARDEWIRDGLTEETLEAMPPLFAREPFASMADARQRALMKARAGELRFRHSLANTPGMADGAALVLTGSRAAGREAGVMPMARIVAFAECGGDEVLQFGAGFTAMEQALERAGLRLEAMDRVEFMEAFAAPPLRFERRYDVDPSRVNAGGGHLAMGHPMGATGAMLITTLVHELRRIEGRYGLVVTLAAGGIGSATVVECM